MRKLVSAVCAAGVVLSLAACSSEASSDSTSSAASTTASASASATADPEVVVSSEGMPTLTEDSDGNPTLDFPSTSAPGNIQVSVLEEGTGAEITSSALIVFDYVLYKNWGDETVGQSSFASGSSMSSSLDGLVSGWKYALAGHHAGSRVILSLPPAYGYGTGGNEAAGISGDDTIVFYVEIHQSFDSTSTGQSDAAVEATADDLPVTIDGAIGSPVTSITVNDGQAEPTEVSTKIIAKGTGEEVPAGATVYVNYAAVSWDGETEENSWSGTAQGYSGVLGPQSIQLGSDSSSDFDGLAGIPVGSRVLLIIPAQEATSDSTTSNPSIAFVMDILGYTPAAAS